MNEVVTLVKAGVQEVNPHQHWIPGSAFPSVTFAGVTEILHFTEPKQYFDLDKDHIRNANDDSEIRSVTDQLPYAATHPGHDKTVFQGDSFAYRLAFDLLKHFCVEADNPSHIKVKFIIHRIISLVPGTELRSNNGA